MKYLILAIMPSLLVIVLGFCFSITKKFKRYLSESEIFSINIAFMFVFGIVSSIVYGIVLNLNFICILVFIFLLSIFYILIIPTFDGDEYENHNKLGFSFIALQLYSIISWWFV